MKRSSTGEKFDVDKKLKSDENEDSEGSRSTPQNDSGAVDDSGLVLSSRERNDSESQDTATPQSRVDSQVTTPAVDLDAVQTISDTETDTDKQGSERAEEEVKMKVEEEPEQKPLERWQLVPTTVRQRMNYLLTTSKLSDCSLLVGKPDSQQEFKLHSTILAMSSPEFEDKLGESKQLSIPDVEPDIFRQMLEYIYLDYVNLWSVEKTQALYRASVKFKLPHLCEKAVEFMMNKMNIDSIWPIFEAAIATQDEILTEECKKFFRKHISDLLKHPNFKGVDYSVIASLVADESLGVPEADLIAGILKWAHQKCLDMELVPSMENKRSMLLSGTISQLRFLALSKEYFVSNVAYSTTRGDESILTMEESYAILMNMIQPHSYPMPEGFSTQVKQRTQMDVVKLVRRVFNPLGTYQAITAQTPRLDKLTVLPGPALTAPYGSKTFSLDLSTSRDITLHGIQVPTFFPGMIGVVPKVYEESYMISLQNSSKPNKPIIASLNWSGKVSYNSFVDLFFKEPVKLDKNTTYTVNVYTNNAYYLNQKLCTVEDINNVKFTLKDSVSLIGKPGKQDFGFVSQLTYST